MWIEGMKAPTLTHSLVPFKLTLPLRCSPIWWVWPLLMIQKYSSDDYGLIIVKPISLEFERKIENFNEKFHLSGFNLAGIFRTKFEEHCWALFDALNISCSWLAFYDKLSTDRSSIESVPENLWSHSNQSVIQCGAQRVEIISSSTLLPFTVTLWSCRVSLTNIN